MTKKELLKELRYQAGTIDRLVTDDTKFGGLLVLRSLTGAVFGCNSPEYAEFNALLNKECGE